ncbi:putative transporter protein, partial [Vibrio parahaemolyticus V-223/04]
RVAV